METVAAQPWAVSAVSGSAGDLLAAFDPGRRELRLCRFDRPAVVLGSAQPATHLGSAPGYEVARRRSGGGAVLLVPGEAVWAEIWLPGGDPLWEADVGRAFWWLGELWARVLTALGASGLSVHTGAPERTRWSAHCCFAGLGSGEVSLAGRKVVGISQRRSRRGALFQCAVALVSRPGELAGLLALPAAERAEAAAALERVAGSGPQLGASPAEVEEALAALLQEV